MAVSIFPIPVFLISALLIGLAQSEDPLKTPFGKGVRKGISDEVFSRLFGAKIQCIEELIEALDEGYCRYFRTIGLPFDESIVNKTRMSFEGSTFTAKSQFSALISSILKVLQSENILKDCNTVYLVQNFVNRVNEAYKSTKGNGITSSFIILGTAVGHFFNQLNVTSEKSVKLLNDIYVQELDKNKGKPPSIPIRCPPSSVTTDFSEPTVPTSSPTEAISASSAAQTTLTISPSPNIPVSSPAPNIPASSVPPTAVTSAPLPAASPSSPTPAFPTNSPTSTISASSATQTILTVSPSANLPVSSTAPNIPASSATPNVLTNSPSPAAPTIITSSPTPTVIINLQPSTVMTSPSLSTVDAISSSSTVTTTPVLTKSFGINARRQIPPDIFVKVYDVAYLLRRQYLKAIIEGLKTFLKILGVPFDHFDDIETDPENDNLRTGIAKNYSYYLSQAYGLQYVLRKKNILNNNNEDKFVSMYVNEIKKDSSIVMVDNISQLQAQFTIAANILKMNGADSPEDIKDFLRIYIQHFEEYQGENLLIVAWIKKVISEL